MSTMYRVGESVRNTTTQELGTVIIAEEHDLGDGTVLDDVVIRWPSRT